MDDIVQWLDYGGVMLIPIAIASLVGVALFVARWRTNRPGRVIPDDLRQTVLDAVDAGRWSEAEEACQNEAASLARVYEEGLRFRRGERHQIRKAMEDVGRRETSRLERFVGAIGALASVTPLMGLLGTVMGMIKVFQGVVHEAGPQGIVDPTALAGGIWEALVTTAAGLAVAIPLYLGYRYLLGKIDELSLELEEAATDLLDRLAPPPNRGEQEAMQPARLVDGEPETDAESKPEQLAAEGA